MQSKNASQPSVGPPLLQALVQGWLSILAQASLVVPHQLLALGPGKYKVVWLCATCKHGRWHSRRASLPSRLTEFVTLAKIRHCSSDHPIQTLGAQHAKLLQENGGHGPLRAGLMALTQMLLFRGGLPLEGQVQFPLRVVLSFEWNH